MNSVMLLALARASAAALLLSGCASGAAVPPAEAGEVAVRGRNVLTAEEMIRDAGDGADVYEAILKLRPHFLRSRPTSMRGSGGGVAVYVGNTPYGGAEALRSFRPTSIRTVRFLTGSDATTLFGTGHGEGVIVVTLK